MSKKNTELATKILEQHGNVQKNETGDHYVANLEAILGMSLGAATVTVDDDGKEHKVSKADAVKQMAKQLAGELDSGALVLADDWEQTNLK